MLTESLLYALMFQLGALLTFIPTYIAVVGCMFSNNARYFIAQTAFGTSIAMFGLAVVGIWFIDQTAYTMLQRSLFHNMAILATMYVLYVEFDRKQQNS